MKYTFVSLFLLNSLFVFCQTDATTKGDNKSIPQKRGTIIEELSSKQQIDEVKNIEKVDNSHIYTSVNVYASPPGGMNNFRNMIASSFKVPVVHQTTMASVIARFVVWDDGSLRDIQIIKETPSNLGLGKEAVRVLSASEKWTPGIYDGRKVKQYYTLPISIQLTPQEKVEPTSKTIDSEKLSVPVDSHISTLQESNILQPEPIEGFKLFYENVQKNIHIFDVETGGTYKTKVSFIVEIDGSLTDFKIIEESPKSVGLGNEVIRVLKTFPNWKPIAVKTHYILPVTIVLEEESKKPNQDKKE